MDDTQPNSRYDVHSETAAKAEPASPPDARNRWSPPRATLADLAGQVRDVLDDLPRFLVAPFLRRRHLTWGATPAEVAAPMPGDGLLPRAQYRCTRAITIDVPPEQVWPWLVQVGYGRAGWYADDLLDNFARPSVREIVPELQDLRIGQWLPWGPNSSERTAFVVNGFAQPSWLLWRSPNRTWAWRLIPVSDGQTRLITRMHTVYEWRRPLTPFTVMLMELADYPMMRRMLRGIRERAEAQH
jgi:hypothetical protein